jgi:phosphoribosylaminoimidazole-succinocarboxamide synthase
VIADQIILEQLPYVITKTNFDFLGEKYAGKARDCYIDKEQRVLITSDRLSCFDVVLTAIPFKGQVLNQMAIQCFQQAEAIIPNHIIAVPDPNVVVAYNCEILPVEVVVRSYLTGSAWRDYQAGRSISGINLPAGMKMSQKLDSNLLTPATKAPIGQHDEAISEAEIIARNLVDQKLWQQVREIALALFELGQKIAAKRGLILVDTKYEFGLINGRLVLADEIHTLDCSRYWVADSYQQAYESGQQPEMLDKEPVRQWLLAQGYMGSGVAPEFTEQKRLEISKHYVQAFEKITGCDFIAEQGDPLARIEKNLKQYYSS